MNDEYFKVSYWYNKDVKNGTYLLCSAQDFKKCKYGECLGP